VVPPPSASVRRAGGRAGGYSKLRGFNFHLKCAALLQLSAAT
jgi:hypothetical protein